MGVFWPLTIECSICLQIQLVAQPGHEMGGNCVFKIDYLDSFDDLWTNTELTIVFGAGVSFQSFCRMTYRAMLYFQVSGRLFLET